MSFQASTRYLIALGLFEGLRQILTSLTFRANALWKCERARNHCERSKQVSILFTDIVGFSHLMTTWSLEEIICSLNDYFERLSSCVYRHRGQVDKFMGDGMMAVFTSPDDAVRAARAIQQEVAYHNSGQLKQKCPPFPTRIVVDTGLVVKTAMGLNRKRDRTVMGPVVNAASHLAKILPPGRVFISHSTCCRLTEPSRWCISQPLTTNECHSIPVIYEATE